MSRTKPKERGNGDNLGVSLFVHRPIGAKPKERGNGENLGVSLFVHRPVGGAEGAAACIA